MDAWIRAHQQASRKDVSRAMTADEKQIRTLIEQWAAAVHEGDLPPRELAEQPANRLRLTLGLRKEQGRWIVAHEHHSFPLAADGAAAAQ